METSPGKPKSGGDHVRSGPLLRARDTDGAPPRHRAPVATAREGTRARSRPLRPVILAAGATGIAVLFVGGAALLGGDARPGVQAAGPRPSASVPSESPSATPGPPADAALSAAVIAATGPGRAPADVRAALEEQLASRAVANLALLRSTFVGDETAAAEAARAVAASSRGVSAVVTAWRDTALAAQLRTGLDRQTAASRAYAAAVASGDVAAADEARGRMGQISRSLGSVLSRVTDGRIAVYVPPQDAAQLRAFVDALRAGDAASADEAVEWLRERSIREGTALAAGLSGGGPS